MENRQPNNISPENFSVSEQEDKPQAEAVPASAPQSDRWSRLVVITLLLVAVIGTYIVAYVLG
jgi:hypothetical protein